jgi:hypothetical protein
MEKDMEEQKKVRKVIELLKHYKKTDTEIIIELKNNKKLDIKGTVDYIRSVSFLGMQPYVLINDMKIFIEDINEDEIYPANTKIKENNYQDRKSIPKSVRMELWRNHFGENWEGRCFVCRADINKENFDAAHKIAEANGGEATLDNLVPTCRTCNRSMGTMDLMEFKRRYH